MNTKLLLLFVVLLPNFSLTISDLSQWFADITQWLGLALGTVLPQLPSATDRELYEEILMDTSQVCSKYGYASEEHSIITKDNFVLKLYRIPYGKNDKSGKNGKNGKKGRKPILIMHGITQTSLFWVSNTNSSLPFFLADNGYDVWMGNFRNTPNTYNLKYSRRQKEFWNFSWEEMGDFDIPDCIDYILNIRRKHKIIYMAHSLGTTSGFAFLSTHSEYHKKIAGFVAFSPITSLYYSPSFLHESRPFITSFTFLVQMLGLQHTTGVPSNLIKSLQYACPASNTIICGLGLDISTGYDPYLRNYTRNFLYVSRATSPTSMKTLIHLAQMFEKKGMYRFDYGLVKNLFQYHSLHPPIYDLKRIKVPVAIVYSANDVFSNAFDNALLARDLPNLLDIKIIAYPMFDHMDIGFAMNSEKLYYNDVLNYAKKMFSQ